MCTRRSLELLLIVARSNIDGSRGLEERNDKDLVGHGLPAIGTTAEEIAAGVVGISRHRRVGRVAVQVSRCRSIPIDQFLVVDEAVGRRLSGFVGGNERLRHLQPALVWPETGQFRMCCRFQILTCP